MTTLETLKQLESQYAVNTAAFTNAKTFMTLLGDKLHGLGKPKVHCIKDTLIIEWLTKDAIWSVDFKDHEAYAMIYLIENDEQDESMTLHESTVMQDIVDFLAANYDEIPYVQDMP